MHECLRPFHDAYRDRTAAARAWKASGGQVVGYLCDNVPEELITAAGFFPLRVAGGAGQDVTPVREHVDRLYPPDVAARPVFVDALLARLLDGTYDVLDYLIVPHNRNAIQAIYRQLHDAKRERPALRIPALYYLDKAWSPYFVAETYNRDSVLKLRDQLGIWAEKPISDAALNDAVHTCNENRALLSEVAKLRIGERPRLSGTDALAIFGSSMFLAKADHTALLKNLLAVAPTLPERFGPRVFVGGSPLDHSGVYELIEGFGATVVAEDHCWGVRACDLPVKATGEPLFAIAERFHRRPACSILFPLERTIEASVNRALRSRADAAIFYVMEGDGSQNWETPDEVARLRSSSMPVLHLRNQPYEPGAAGELHDRIASFLRSFPKAADRVAASHGVGGST